MNEAFLLLFLPDLTILRNVLEHCTVRGRKGFKVGSAARRGATLPQGECAMARELVQATGSRLFHRSGVACHLPMAPPIAAACRWTLEVYVEWRVGGNRGHMDHWTRRINHCFSLPSAEISSVCLCWHNVFTDEYNLSLWMILTVSRQEHYIIKRWGYCGVYHAVSCSVNGFDYSNVVF